jgi:hypothetical protein
VHLRESLLQPGTEIEEVLERQVGMQAADDVEFGDGFAVSGGSRLEGFFERHGVGPGRVFFPPEGAKAACSYANIRRINVPIYVEVCAVSMHSLSHEICQPSNGKDVASAIQIQRVIFAQAIMSNDLIVDRMEA